MNNIKQDFPIFKNNPNLIYLDSACTTLKPRSVIEAQIEYYEKYGACAGRSSHKKARETTEKIEETREKIADFVGAEAEGTVWTKNATEAINIVINGFDFSKKKKVITTNMEHHTVLLPLMRMRDDGRIKLTIIENDRSESNLEEEIRKKIDTETALVILNNANNTTGKRQQLKSIGQMVHDFNARLCVDGAQGVPHFKCDMKKENIDFLAFSAHKMLGPTGIGALASRKEELMILRPTIVGGGNVKRVTIETIEWANDLTRFEPGIQNYSGILGFGAAIEYIRKIGMENIETHEKGLRKEMIEQIQNAGARIYGNTQGENASALVSFNFKDSKAHEIALMLDHEKIAVRSGFFCAQPAMEAIGAKDGAVRASGYLYNNSEDIKKFGEKLEKIGKIYN